MWTTFYDWSQHILADTRVVGGAIFGFISALLIFLIRDVIWAHRMEGLKSQKDIYKNQLDNLYAPLYQFYCEAYVRYDLWKKDNQDTVLDRQPFFDSDNDEDFVENILSNNGKYASQTLLRLWSIFRATSDKPLRNKRRRDMVMVLIKEYQGLRKELGLAYNDYELIKGQFRNANLTSIIDLLT